MKTLIGVLKITIVLFLLLLLIGPFMVPIPPLEGTVPPEQLADADSRFIEVADINLHYKMSGDGQPALILLHGFGASLFSWREVFQPLAENYQVVAFDRPAFGLTERPMEWTGENPYSPEFQAKLTVDLMDQLGIQKAVLVGNSAGGTVATLTALLYPQRIQALVLVDPAITMSGSPGWFGLLAKTPQMQRLGPLLARSIQSRGKELIELAWHDPSKVTPQVWAGYTKPLQTENWDRALWYLSEASKDLNLEQKLDQLQLPVLVITGDDDRIVPTETTVQLAGELPNARLIILPACGHVPQEECPQAFLDAVVQFLSEEIQLQTAQTVETISK